MQRFELAKENGDQIHSKEKKICCKYATFKINLMVTHPPKNHLRNIALKQRKQSKEAWNTTKQNQLAETQRKRNYGGTELPENKGSNGHRKSSYINSYHQCK